MSTPNEGLVIMQALGSRERYMIKTLQRQYSTWVNPVCSHIAREYAKCIRASDYEPDLGDRARWSKHICKTCRYGIIHELGDRCGNLHYVRI